MSCKLLTRQLINLLTHQLINSPTYQLINYYIFAIDMMLANTPAAVTLAPAP